MRARRARRMLLRYRDYARQLEAGCWMHGIFVFASTGDVVVRFARALHGEDIERSYGPGDIVGVSVRRRPTLTAAVSYSLTEYVLSIDATDGLQLQIPQSWLVDSTHLVAASIEEQLGSGASSSYARDLDF